MLLHFSFSFLLTLRIVEFWHNRALCDCHCNHRITVMIILFWPPDILDLLHQLFILLLISLHRWNIHSSPSYTAHLGERWVLTQECLMINPVFVTSTLYVLDVDGLWPTPCQKVPESSSPLPSLSVTGIALQNPELLRVHTLSLFFSDLAFVRFVCLKQHLILLIKIAHFDPFRNV